MYIKLAPLVNETDHQATALDRAAALAAQHTQWVVNADAGSGWGYRGPGLGGLWLGLLLLH